MTERSDRRAIEPDWIEVRRYQLGLLCEVGYAPEGNLVGQLQSWQGLPVVLHRSAAGFAETLRTAGFTVRGGSS